MKTADSTSLGDRLTELCEQFGLNTLRGQLGARFLQAGLSEALPLLLDLLEVEAADRRERRTLRLLTAAQLPHAKTLGTLDQKLLPHKLRLQLQQLCTGEFIDKAHNALLFGLPGVGKTHVAAAVGVAACQLGYSVRFVSACRLAQQLLLAKRECQLPRALRKLDAFDLVIVDDLGYLQQSPEEAEVLFTLIAERYERRSLMLTTNLMFSQWSRIFRDEMATAAAVDRLVHHSVILEFSKDSFRGSQAARLALQTKEVPSPS